MKILRLFLPIATLLICFSFTTEVTDYLNIPGPISFDKSKYNLSWSSHPNDNYYKQEYLVKGDNADKFNKMIMIDFITGDMALADAVDAQVSKLKKMKETNPVVNYEVIKNPDTGEYMLDFLVSENTPDGKSISVIERNVYRYKKITDKNGIKGIELFGISTRSYGDDITRFFANLKTHRDDMLNALGGYQIPEITVTKQ